MHIVINGPTQLRAAFKDKNQYHKVLCDSLGIEIRPPTKTEKVFGFLRKASDIAFKTAVETNKILTSSGSKPRKQRNRCDCPRGK